MTMAATDLVKELRRQVTALEADLRVRSEEVPEAAKRLQAEYADAKEAKRTAATYESWREDRITQVAAAWVLGTVFVRYCEDNDLIAQPFIAGPGERLTEAEERHEAHFRDHPHDNDRDWIVAAFDHLANTHPTAAGLFDKAHNALWEIPPSFEAATALLQYWRRRDDDGEIRVDFTGWDTRFLGDLYQDLSEHARKTYALLQPQNSSRNSSSTSPWNPPSRSLASTAYAPSTPPAVPATSSSTSSTAFSPNGAKPNPAPTPGT